MRETSLGESGAPVTGFPLRVAAVDVGSNAIRFIAAEFESATRWRSLASRRFPVRLGHGAFLTGELAQTAMDAAIEAFQACRASLDELGIDHMRAVATSAVRESRNGPAFVERVRETSGIELGLISGSEEARLVWQAVRRRIEFGTAKWMLVDLGGGSVEVSLVDEGGVMWSESHTMGAVRLLEELSEVADVPRHFSRLLAEYAATLRIPAAAKHWTPVEMIATGGNIEALGRLVGSPSPDATSLVLTRADLAGAIDRLSGLSFDERVERLGLREDRADVILPAAIVYDRVAELAGAERIRVPGVGVKEGVLLDLVEELTGGAGLGRRERIVREGARTLGRRYLFDESHALHVADLALSLFDQLSAVHGLDETDRVLLIACAVLHDIGQHISYRKHHKHSLYLILHSEIPGISPSELPLVALVARYHRRAEPSEDHYLFGALDAADRARVERIAAILRVADSLDREHLQRVGGVEARPGPETVELRLLGDGPFHLEQWALRKKGRFFTRVFGRDLVTADSGA